MNTFKRKALFTAVAAGLGAAAGTAEAVYLSPQGLGQVLIYPYYTAQTLNGATYNTYISVVNTTSRAKAVKVRVIEGKTSAEVLDFNLYLSPNDVWTAAIGPVSTDAAAGAQIATGDNSCTAPSFVTSPPTPVPFRNFRYATGAPFGHALPGVGLDRTREGYIEVIEMGVLTGTAAANTVHGATSIPLNCGYFQVTGTPTGFSIEAPQGGLMGTGTLINTNSGLDAGYKADALDAWSVVPIFSDPTAADTPRLSDANPAVSVVVRNGDIDPVTLSSALITAYRTDWLPISNTPEGARAVAAVYMHSSVLNEYILDTNTSSNTDWVLTQPIKNMFVSNASASTPYTALLTASGACETIGFTFFNREERGAAAAGTDFSPQPPGAAANTLCWEANVLSIRNGVAHTTTPTNQSLVLGSFNLTNVTITTGAQNGWAELSFTGGGASSTGMAGGAATSERADLSLVGPIVVTAGDHTFFGLPVTGFMVRTFRSNVPLPCAAGSTATCANAYSSLFNHSYHTTIVP